MAGPFVEDIANVILPIGKKPIIYSPKYNITFGGIENLHPFDSKKYMRTRDFLVYRSSLAVWFLISVFSEAGVLKDDEFCDVPYMPTEQQLLAVHSQSYRGFFSSRSSYRF